MAEYQTQLVRYGVGGLDLRRTADLVTPENATRLSNVVRTQDGAWKARLGQTSYATAGAGVSHHSIRRLEDPIGGTVTRLWGAGSSLYRGPNGALNLVEAGFSGDPMSFVPWHPPQSGESWMVVGDRTKMRKVRASDGLTLPLGLPAPAAPVPTVNAALNLTISDFDNGWSGGAGTGAAPFISYLPGVDGNGLYFNSDPGAAAGAYYSYAIQDFGGPQNFNDFGGSNPITDDDYIHFYTRTANGAGLITEIRIYFIIDFGFLGPGGVLPGTNDAQNTQFYYKSFSTITYPSLVDGGWIEFGRPETEGVFSLRRSDFTRVGTIGGGSWGNIAGLCVAVFYNTNTTAPIVIFDKMYFEGGSAPDTGAPESSAYTYKVTNFDPRTGAESNGSSTSDEVSPYRQSMLIDPAAYGDASMRQRFYRMGGTATDDWQFVGVNTSDGGTFTDNLSDDEAETGASVPTDHFQPLPTVDSTGTSVLDQPAPYLWASGDGIIFAAGDKYRPGAVYFCKPGEVDHWGADDFCDVCGPTEKVINGFVLGNQSFAWSSQRLYVLNVINTGSDITVNSSAANCTRAPAGPWAFAVGATYCVFCSADGIWVTDGGPEQSLSEDWIGPLFRGETVNGYLPVDFAQYQALRMEIYQNEVWFFYQDTGGTRRVMLYDMSDKNWRIYTFAKATEMGYAENVPGLTQMLLGSHLLATTYAHSGIGDAGVIITGNIRTPALNQGDPKNDKLYGDIRLDIDRQDTTIIVTPYTDYETTALDSLNLRTGDDRRAFYYNFDEPPLRAKNLSIDISWSSATARPEIFSAYISYLNTPDAVQGRPLDFDLAGNHALKSVKGIVLEADTLGVQKLLNLELDGVVVQQFSVTCDGRRVIETSWAPQEGHEIRLVPADNVLWELYSYHWLFDLEPYSLARWETQRINHGIKGWQMSTGGFITLRSTAAVTLTVVAYNQAGTAITKTYTISSTSGAKQNCFVPFEATKGVLYKYTLTSTAAFRLYHEESFIWVQPWAGGEPIQVSVFGNDDLDPSRAMGVAALAAVNPGGEAQ